MIQQFTPYDVNHYTSMSASEKFLSFQQDESIMIIFFSDVLSVVADDRGKDTTIFEIVAVAQDQSTKIFG